VFEHKIGLTDRRHAGVKQPCDVGMIKTRQDVAFPAKSFEYERARQGHVQEFHRHLAFEAAVAPARQPNVAHSALSDRAYQRVRADSLAFARPFARQRNKLIEEPFLAQFSVLIKQHLHVSRDVRIFQMERGQPAAAFRVAHLQSPIEERT
jgi:hypothetical protein